MPTGLRREFRRLQARQPIPAPESMQCPERATVLPLSADISSTPAIMTDRINCKAVLMVLPAIPRARSPAAFNCGSNLFSVASRFVAAALQISCACSPINGHSATLSFGGGTVAAPSWSSAATCCSPLIVESARYHVGMIMIARPIKTMTVADSFLRPPTLPVRATCAGYTATLIMMAQTTMLINGEMIRKHQ